MSLTSANSQLKTISHYYQHQDNSSMLVYNSKDNSFYTVGKKFKFDKNYITNSKKVTKKISEFLNENQSVLKPKLLEEFNNCLKGRVSKIKAKIYGLLGLLTMAYHILNPRSKARFEQERQTLSQLYLSMDQILKNPDKHKAIQKNTTPTPAPHPDNHVITPQPPKPQPTKPISEQPQPQPQPKPPKPISVIQKPLIDPQTPLSHSPKPLAQPYTPLQEEPETPTSPDFEPSSPDVSPLTIITDAVSPGQKPQTDNNAIPIDSELGPKNLHSPMKLSSHKKAPVHYKTPQKFVFAPPVYNTPLKDNIDFSEKSETDDFSIPDAPEAPDDIPPPPPPPGPPLSMMEGNNYTPVPKLVPNEPEPLPFDLLDYKKLPLDEILDQIEDIDTYVNQAQAAIGEVVDIVTEHLNLKELHQSKMDEAGAIDSQLKQCLANIKKLKDGEQADKIVNLSIKIGPLTTDVPFYPASLAKTVKEDAPDVETVSKLLNPTLLQSNAIHQYQQLADYFKPLFDKVMNQIKNIEIQHQQLKADCQKQFGKDLVGLETALTNKQADLKSWSTQGLNRAKFRNAKLKGLKTPALAVQTPNANAKLDEIYEKYPFLKKIQDLPQQVQILLKAIKMKHDTTKECAEGFTLNLYGKLNAN